MIELNSTYLAIVPHISTYIITINIVLPTSFPPHLRIPIPIMSNPEHRASMLPECFKEDCFAAVLEVSRPRTPFPACNLM